MTDRNELPKRAMVIVAHPDDAEFGSAGTVAKWTKEGWDVRYVIVTDGASGGPDEATDVSPEAQRKVVETRQAEQREAGRILGLSGIDFLNYRDGQVQHTIELRKELVRLLRTHKPTRLIAQSPDRIWEPSYSIGRYHPDHLAVAETAIAALYPASQNPWDFPELLMEEGLEPHKVSELWIVGAPHANQWVDVTDTIDTKVAALRAHNSQLVVAANFEEVEQMVRGWMSETGRRYGVEYAEEFHVSWNGIRQPPDSDAELAHSASD